MWTIIPDNQENYDQLNPKRLGYTYLHGQLEKDCGYDCYGLMGCDIPNKEDSAYIDDSNMMDDKYPCEYNGKDCTLYFWHCSYNKPHGLVVYNSDITSIEYAEKKLKEKSIII